MNLPSKLVAAFLLSALLCSDAQACSVCFDAKAETRYAFYWTTAFLTLLPLCMMSGIVYFIRQKTKEI